LEIGRTSVKEGMSLIQNDEDQRNHKPQLSQLGLAVSIDSNDAVYCSEMEYLVNICFITPVRTKEELNEAMRKLEEFFLPEFPAPHTVKMLIGIYLKTKCQVVQMTITQRLAMYILERWQCLDQTTVAALETFLGQSINNLSIEGLLATESAKYTSSLLRVLTSLMVTYYGEIQLVEGVLSEMRKFIVADKYATVALGLSVLESFLECLVSQVNSPQKRFSQNVAKSQIGKNPIWTICTEALKIIDNAQSGHEISELPTGCAKSKLNLLITPNVLERIPNLEYLDRQLVLKLLTVLALAARLNRPPHRDADDFWDEPGQQPSISTMPTNYRSALGFYKTLPNHLPALWKLVTMFKPEEELYVKFFEIFRFISGFSLYLYKDRNLDLSLPNTYETLFNVLGDILNPEKMILSKLREFGPSDLADCLASAVPEQVIPGKVFKELVRFHEVINNSYHHTVDRFRSASSTKGVTAQEAAALYRFWTRVQHLQTRAPEAYASHISQVMDIQEKSLQCFESICRSFTKGPAALAPEEALEVLCKLGRTLYGIYELDISKFIFVVQNVLRSNHLAFTDSVTALLLFLIISENLSPRLVERSETASIRKVFAELAPRAINVLYERTVNLPESEDDGLILFFRLLSIRVISSLLLDWIAPQSWDFTEFKTDFAQNFSNSFPTNSELDYKHFLIKMIASEELLERRTFNGYLNLLKRISDVSRLERKADPPQFIFMLGKAAFRLEDIKSLQLSHYGDLNYHLGLDLQSGKSLYTKLSRLCCLSDNLFTANQSFQKIEMGQSQLSDLNEEAPFTIFIRPLLTYLIAGSDEVQKQLIESETREKICWGLAIVEGVTLGVTSGSCLTRIFQLFQEHNIFERISLLVQKLDDAPALNLGLGAITALAKRAKELMIEDEHILHFLDVSSELLTLIIQTLAKLLPSLQNSRTVEFYERFLQPLSKTCNVISSLLECHSSAVSAKGAILGELVLQIISGILPTKLSSCVEHSRELFDFLMIATRAPLYDLPTLDGDKASQKSQEILRSKIKKLVSNNKLTQENNPQITQIGCKVLEFPRVLILFAVSLEASDHCIRATSLLTLTSIFSRGIAPFVAYCRQPEHNQSIKSQLLEIWSTLKDLAIRIFNELQLVCSGTRTSDSLGGAAWITCLYWTISATVFMNKSELELQGAATNQMVSILDVVPQLDIITQSNTELAELVLDTAQTGWGKPKTSLASFTERLHKIMGTSTTPSIKNEKLDEEY
jgi:hypothetical protein